MNFYNKTRNRNNIQSLSQALSRRDNNDINIGGVTPPSKTETQGQSIFGGASDLIGGGMKLYNGVKDSGLFNSGTTGETPISLAINNEVLGNTAPYGGIVGGALRAGTSALNGGRLGVDMPQSFFGIDKNKSDVSQALSGAGQGAVMGSAFGPVGTAVGAALGLGSSFLDDL